MIKSATSQTSMYPDVEKFRDIAEFISKDSDKYFNKFYGILYNFKRQIKKIKLKSTMYVFRIN